MYTVTTPIAASTSLSILLHGVVAVAWLTLYDQTNPVEAVGQGVEVELISAITAADQHETELSHEKAAEPSQQEIAKQEIVREAINDTPSVEKYRKNNDIIVMVGSHDEADVYLSESAEKETIQAVSEKHAPERQQQSIFENDGNSPATLSTNASQQRHAILELLHSSISSNKKYPYLARRQRREGITTVAFILHPDGSIENTRLINSSQTTALDRAALSAVRGIEPFIVAQEYILQSEEFRVDVVFDLI